MDEVLRWIRDTGHLKKPLVHLVPPRAMDTRRRVAGDSDNTRGKLQVIIILAIAISSVASSEPKKSTCQIFHQKVPDKRFHSQPCGTKFYVPICT